MGFDSRVWTGCMRIIDFCELYLTGEKAFANWIICMIKAESREIVLEGVPSIEPQFVHRQGAEPTLHLLLPTANMFEEAMTWLRSKTEEAVCMVLYINSSLIMWAAPYNRAKLDTLWLYQTTGSGIHQRTLLIHGWDRLYTGCYYWRGAQWAERSLTTP